jgi:hypothetical protein
MNLDNYPHVFKYLNKIEDKNKFLLNIMTIKDDNNTSNTIHITNYEVTTKISHYYLNHSIPISRNSNTVSIKSNYASYVYYMTIYILLGLNNYQYYSHGEFIINNEIMYDLVDELTKFIQVACDENDLGDALKNLKQTVKDIVLNIQKEKVDIIEKIENIYDEKDMFSDKIEKIDENIPDINKNVLIT